MKAIFFDIDGTILGQTSGKMPDSTKAAIKRARENGHLCFINTGRTRRMVGRDITELVEFDGYLMGCGTMILYQGQVLLHKTFSGELSRQIMEGLDRYHIDALLEGSLENYSRRGEEIYSEEFRKFSETYRDWHYGSYEEAPGNYDKLYAYGGGNGDMAGFCREFEAELDFIDRENGYYEIVPKGCSKAGAIHYIAEMLHIPLEDTVAIGDSSNDIPMLAYAHTSIAMGNSTREVRQMADYITEDADGDGIWKALEWLGVL